ncbi:MAG: (Fe-S)-binding protein, partial [Euryarchaeota archaeon]|nr:(Fe-S)-binding protein [Euryarchaeota archaeon]
MARREPSLTTERFTTSQLLEIDACTRCGECLNWCPVLEEIQEETFTPEGREGMTDKQKMDFSPKNKLTGMREMLNKGYGLRAKLFGPKQIPEDEVLKLKDEIYHCTTCGICSTV